MSQSYENTMKPVSADVLVNSEPDYCGTVQKKNNSGKFQYRYCIIHRGIFYYFEDWKSRKPKGYFSLAGYRAIRSKEKNELMFILKNKDDKRTYLFSAGSNRELTEWVDHVNSAVDKYHPVSSPFYNPYTEGSMYGGSTAYQSRPLPQHNQQMLKRSPSITSSTSSNSNHSTSSYGSYGRCSEDGTLTRDPIYEEVMRGADGEPIPMEDLSHYDHLPNPYEPVNPRYDSPRKIHEVHELDEDEGMYVRVIDLEEDPYVRMQHTQAAVNSNPQEEEYVDMSPEKYNEIINDKHYEKMHEDVSEKDLNPQQYLTDIDGYEPMDPRKYERLIANNTITSSGDMEKYPIHGDSDGDDSSEEPYIDLTEPDSPGELNNQNSCDSDVELQTTSNNLNNYNTRAELPPLPPESADQCDCKPTPQPRALGLKPEKIVHSRNLTSPVPPPRPHKSLQESLSALTISQMETNPNSPPNRPLPGTPGGTPGEVSSVKRQKQQRGDVTYMVTEIEQPPLLKNRRYSNTNENPMIPPPRPDSRPGSRSVPSPVPPPRSKISLQEKVPNMTEPLDDLLLPPHIFIPKLQKEKCVPYLQKQEVGSYLIRTARADGNDALAVKCGNGEIKHYIIFYKHERYYLKSGEPMFDTVSDLIRYYYENNLPTIKLFLTGPMKKNH